MTILMSLKEEKKSTFSSLSSRIPVKYLIKRIVERIVLIIVIISFLFFLFRVLPLAFHVNPASFYVPPTYKGLSRSTLIEAIDRQWGLNQPFYIQYIDYLKNMLTFNFGYSLTYDESITTLVMQAVPVDLLILIPSLILSTILAIILGILSATKQGKLVDTLNSTIAIFTYFIPAFWIFAIVLYYFGYQLGWVPTNIADALTKNGVPLHGFAYVAGLLKFIALPVILLTILSYGVRMILTRAYGIDASNSHFATYLRARGIPNRTILYKHIARNAIIPAVTRTGIDFAFVLAGAVFVEEIFNYYGMGVLLVQSAENFNVPILEAVFYIINLYAIIVLLILDLVYPFIDPRVKYE
ncbi:ABC transporter permease [Sulfolobus sp. S-194]|nr:ABC transporter permease [Sulfolobus sp. S-194]